MSKSRLRQKKASKKVRPSAASVSKKLRAIRSDPDYISALEKAYCSSQAALAEREYELLLALSRSNVDDDMIRKLLGRQGARSGVVSALGPPLRAYLEIRSFKVPERSVAFAAMASISKVLETAPAIEDRSLDFFLLGSFGELRDESSGPLSFLLDPEKSRGDRLAKRSMDRKNEVVIERQKKMAKVNVKELMEFDKDQQEKLRTGVRNGTVRTFPRG